LEPHAQSTATTPAPCARVEPNPARDRLTVKLPREERRHGEPPTSSPNSVRSASRRFRFQDGGIDNEVGERLM
jgi:hypothetical protein